MRPSTILHGQSPYYCHYHADCSLHSGLFHQQQVPTPVVPVFHTAMVPSLTTPMVSSWVALPILLPPLLMGPLFTTVHHHSLLVIRAHHCSPFITASHLSPPITITHYHLPCSLSLTTAHYHSPPPPVHHCLLPFIFFHFCSPSSASAPSLRIRLWRIMIYETFLGFITFGPCWGRTLSGIFKGQPRTRPF